MKFQTRCSNVLTKACRHSGKRSGGSRKSGGACSGGGKKRWSWSEGRSGRLWSGNSNLDATEVVDLGVTVASNMRFDKHINKIVTKAHRRAALICRCFKSKKQIFCLELLRFMCVQF